MAEKWIQKATEKMKEKGTVGSFGKATPSKIARAKRHGGKEAKKAIFAQNIAKIAQSKKIGRPMAATQTLPQQDDIQNPRGNETVAQENQQAPEDTYPPALIECFRSLSTLIGTRDLISRRM